MKDVYYYYNGKLQSIHKYNLYWKLSQQKDCPKFIIIILFYKLHYQKVFVINTEFESIALSHVELEHTNTN